MATVVALSPSPGTSKQTKAHFSCLGRRAVALRESLFAGGRRPLARRYADREGARRDRATEVCSRRAAGVASPPSAVLRVARPNVEVVERLQHLVRVTVAAPSFPTSTPAAKFAMTAASAGVPPAASIAARYAVTVSPAPTTSYTSRADGRHARHLAVARRSAPSRARRA